MTTTFSDEQLHCEHDCTPVGRSNKRHLLTTHLKLPCCISREQMSWLLSCTIKYNLCMWKQMWYCLIRVDVVMWFLLLLLLLLFSWKVKWLCCSKHGWCRGVGFVSVENSVWAPSEKVRSLHEKKDVVCRHLKASRLKLSHVLYSLTYFGFCNREVVVLNLKYCACS